MVRRIAAGLLGVAMIVAVVYLGFLSGSNPAFVVWFGIASALLAPLGLGLAGYSVSPGNRELVKRLSQVPEIEALVERAKTTEEKIKLLEAERARLVDIVQLEGRRQAIKDRRSSLERDAVRILDELAGLDEEERALGDRIHESPAQQTIQRLHERVRAKESGDVFLQFGSRQYRIDRDVLLGFTPFGLGRLLLAYFRILEWLLRRLRRAGA